MNIKHHNRSVPAALTPRALLRPAASVKRSAGRIIGGTSLATLGMFLAVSNAFAQATPATNGIGAQMQDMAQEASTTGGFVGSTAMYVAALVCFVGGVWALWQSRQEQNRSSGKVAMGLAGVVLTGLFATGGVWIGKASQTASGSNASVNSTSSAVTFGNGQ